MMERTFWRRAGKRLAQTLGFTLIEMAIVLVVIGLIVSGGLVAIGPVVENANIKASNQNMDRVEQALVLHVIRHGCLPCPAGPAEPATGTYAPGQAVSGTTAYTTGCAVTGACAFSPGVGRGVVPWVNLGISEADASDAFGTRFSYAVTPALALAASGTTAGMLRVTSAYPAGTLQVTAYNGTTIITDVAAYVLIGHGPDRGGGNAIGTGTATGVPPYSSTAETGNADGNEPFVQDESRLDKSGTTYFDDIVRWRSAPFVIQQCGANSCGNPL